MVFVLNLCALLFMVMVEVVFAEFVGRLELFANFLGLDVLIARAMTPFEIAAMGLNMFA